MVADMAAPRAASSLCSTSAALQETLARCLFIAGGDGIGSAQRLHLPVMTLLSRSVPSSPDPAS